MKNPKTIRRLLHKRPIKDAGIIAIMMALGLMIFFGGYELIVSYIKATGGCARLGTLQSYCGNDGMGGFAVPGSYMILALVLTFLAPPFITKVLISKFDKSLSWTRMSILYAVSIPLGYVLYSIVLQLTSSNHGV